MTDLIAQVDRTLAGTVRKALKQHRPLPASAVADIQRGALEHPDEQVRRWCLFLLDHYANDASTAVFAEALQDPSPLVRDLALHSITCEGCKDGDLCVTDVVPHVINLVEVESVTSLRVKGIGALLQMSSRDARAVEALERVAATDPDPLLRSCAAHALEGRWVPPAKRYERSQRRHAKPHR